MKMGIVVMGIAGWLSIVALLPVSSWAQSSDYEFRRRIEQLEKRLGLYEQAEKEKPQKLTDHIVLSGALEFDFETADDSDVSDSSVNDATSDFKLGTAEIGVAIAPYETARGSLFLKGEDIGDGDDATSDDVFVDEAIITLQKQTFPFYFVGGKRTQPFGYFVTNLVTDPITQDLYEINKAGATIGWTPGILNMDVSLTAYRGETLADKAEKADLGFTRDKSGTYSASNDVSSFIANATAYCLDDCIALALFFNSEPGDGDRNQTIGGTVHYAIEPIKVDLDAEFMTAVSRENAGGDEEAKESPGFLAVAYQVSDPLQLAVR